MANFLTDAIFAGNLTFPTGYLSDYIYQEKQLLVPESQKLHVIRQLMQYPSITDLQVETASLEQIYQYFIDNKSGLMQQENNT